MNPQETWTWLGLQCLGFAVMGAVVYVLICILRFQSQPWPFRPAMSVRPLRPRRGADGLVLLSILFFALAPSKAAPQYPTQARSYDPSDVINQVAVALVLLGPVLLSMRWRREPWPAPGC